ncbi:MAG: type II toxin-antitoxin system MqsA family antitoxin [Bacteroidales bacterium]|nr:type II toxin-antitoxin system MqsA family antitoxin [Bacteroidales bacterium]
MQLMNMNCPHCGSKTEKNLTTYTIDLGEVLVVIRRVPCYQCDHCGEIVYDADVFQNIEKIVGAAKTMKQEVSIVDYKKVA